MSGQPGPVRFDRISKEGKEGEGEGSKDDYTCRCRNEANAGKMTGSKVRVVEFGIY